MAKIVETTTHALWPKGSNGRGVHVACDHYDDGGVVFRSPNLTRGGNYLNGLLWVTLIKPQPEFHWVIEIDYGISTEMSSCQTNMYPVSSVPVDDKC